jgi:hypothetical protein
MRPFFIPSSEFVEPFVGGVIGALVYKFAAAEDVPAQAAAA